MIFQGAEGLTNLRKLAERMPQCKYLTVWSCFYDNVFHKRLKK